MIYIIIICAIAIIVYVLFFNSNKSTNTCKTTAYKHSGLENSEAEQKTFSKDNSSSYKNTTGDKQSGHNYWNEFKQLRPLEALEIERVTVRDMDSLSDKNASEIVSSLTEWSKSTDIPIKDLKRWFLESFDIKVQESELEASLYALSQKKEEEAKRRNISEENTISALMEEFIINSDFLLNHTDVYNQVHQRLTSGFKDNKKKKKEFRDMVMNLLKAFIPNDDSPERSIDKNVALIISSEVLNMIRKGNLQDYPLNDEVQTLLNIAIKKKQSLNLKEDELDRMLSEIQKDFMHSF